jgi:hypothetical protein
MLHPFTKTRFLALVLSLLFFPFFVALAQQSLKETAKTAKLSPDLFQMGQKQAAARPNANARMATGVLPGTNEPMPDDVVFDLPYQIIDGKIAIDAIANEDGLALLTELQAMGMEHESVYDRMVFGYFPIDRLNDLKNVASLRFARPALAPANNIGRTTSQGDKAMRSDIARQTSGLQGAGQKIGILSDSYDFLGGAGAGVASDDLPANVQVIDDFVPGRTSATDEGRGMAEIVHDVAPEAAIAFNTASRGQSGFANGILNLAKAGCNIIVDDVIYFAEPFFQDGVVAQAVNRVVSANKVAFFSATGNNARRSYQNRFVNSGRPAPGLTLADGVAHNFMDGRLTQQVTIPPLSNIRLVLQWDDPFFSVSGGQGARTDLDLLVYQNGRLLGGAASGNIGNDPVEILGITNNSSVSAVSYDLVIVNYAGPDPAIIKWVDFGSGTFQYATNSSTTYGHSNAEGAIAVGAARYDQTPAFNSQLVAPVIRSFSSAGGTPIYFNTRGERLGAPVVRQKPEVVGPDGGNTTFFPPAFLSPLSASDFDRDGFPNFGGTSAAAPHVAALAALMQQQARNTLSPTDIRTKLIQSAIDMDDPSTSGFDTGFDFGTGYGFVLADRALAGGQSFAIAQPQFNCQTGQITLSTTNGNGSPVEYRIAGVTDWTTNPIQVLGAGLINDPNTTTVQIMARQGGQTASLSFNFREFCRPTPSPVVPGTTFALVQPLFNCLNGLITIRTTAGNGSPIEYQIPGIMGWTSDPVQVLPPGVFLDTRTTTLLLQARQNGQVVSLNFNFRTFCTANYPGNTRLATEGASTPLQAVVLGNPTTTDWAEVLVTGAENQSLQLRVSNSRGEWVSEQTIEKAEGSQQRKVSLGRAPGLYLVRVSTPTHTTVVKVLRQ